MTITANPHEMLVHAANILQERGATHGDFENNFQLIADIFSLRIGRDFHPYEVCILLECVKDARMFANPGNIDNYLDGINYRAFAALFAQDYIEKASSEVTYKKKAEIKKGEMKAVEIVSKPAPKTKINVESLPAELAR